MTKSSIPVETQERSIRLLSRRRNRTIFMLFVAIGCGACLFAIGYSVLTVGHPNGDAYILFRYVENTAGGHGIVYNVGGERAEGATDFLWFLLLTLAVRLGADVAIAAACLNSVGVGLAGWLLGGLCRGEAGRPVWVSAALCCALPVVFRSVAADRGRQSNYVYCAAKGAVKVFLEGLRNRLHPAGVNVLTLKIGRVDTPMTASLRKGIIWARSDRVAADICKAIERKRDVAYVPWFWRGIMMAIRAIPERLFKRLRL